LAGPQVCYTVILMNALTLLSGTVSTDDPSFVARNDEQSFAQEITTNNGTVVFQIDASTTPGQFISGVLDSQIPFCLGRGFVMVGMLMPDGTEGKLFVCLYGCQFPTFSKLMKC
jgi:hypothetical protein